MQSVSWVINQSIAKTFASGAGSSNFSKPGSNSFSSAVGSFSFDLRGPSFGCSDEIRQVKFDQRSVTFDDVWCGNGTFRGTPGFSGPYFYMTTLRRNGAFLEIISFTFSGQRPTSGIYDIKYRFVEATYSIFIRVSENLFEGVGDYQAVNGTLSIESTPTSFSLTSSSILFLNLGNSLRLGVDLRCCD